MKRKRKAKIKKRKIFLYVVLLALVAFITPIVVFVFSLPDVKKLNGSIKIERHIKDGDATKTVPFLVGEKNPDFTPLSQISDHLKHAVIVSEDIEFFHHNGFNIHEIGESVKRNIKRMQLARGGSTITQQLMKNVYLSGEKTFLRKAKEAILTFQAEKLLSKNRILELYLNIIEWGDGIYGIKRAAEHCFGKSPAGLNPDESAYLAALIPNPVKYSRARAGSRLAQFVEKRKNTIIRWMEKAGYLDSSYGAPENQGQPPLAQPQAGKGQLIIPRKKEAPKDEEEELYKAMREFEPDEAFKENNK
jgi:monofunctional biosynthetic peptidoglycan transglycosylase